MSRSVKSKRSGQSERLEVVVDPTLNVKDLVDAAVKRQDDLREQQAFHVRSEMRMRAEHAKDLREAEARRLDAIREVDSSTVEAAALVQRNQADALAKTVTETSQAQADRLRAELAPINASIESLRRSQYEGKGKVLQVEEGQASSNNTGLWVGIAVGAISGAFGLLLSAIAVVVTIVLNR